VNFWDATILGIIEGITEFLPISSTGHLILAGHALRIPESEFLKSFEIAIQLGAILSVVALYFRSFLNVEIVKRVLAGFIPTAVIGFAFYPLVKSYLLGSEIVVVVALFLGGIALIIFELIHKEKEDASGNIESMSYAQAAGVGLAQSLAIIPGVSRSAASIVGGLLLGMKRGAIVEFSFLLAVPTMLAATGLDVLKSYSSFSGGDFSVLAVGFVVSFLVALGVIKFLLWFIRTRTFIAFGLYRILAATIFWLVFF
jgi:undecaprenyl-diphosphatase